MAAALPASAAYGVSLAVLGRWWDRSARLVETTQGLPATYLPRAASAPGAPWKPPPKSVYAGTVPGISGPWGSSHRLPSAWNHSGPGGGRPLTYPSLVRPKCWKPRLYTAVFTFPKTERP